LPVKKGPYTEKIGAILNYDIFKLLTDPRKFSEGIKWGDRRDILIDLIGGYSDEQVFSLDEEMLRLKKIVGKSEVEEFYELTKHEISTLNKEVKKIPVRIDEAHNSIVDDDFDAIETELGQLKNELKSVNEQIADSSKVSDSDVRKQATINDAKLRANEMETAVKDKYLKEKSGLVSEMSERKIDLAVKDKELKSKLGAIKSLVIDNEKLTTDQDKLREKWHAESDKVFSFDEDLDGCPVCKRPYSDVDKQELMTVAHEHFKAEKARRLQVIQREGTNLSASINLNNEKIKTTQTEIETLESEIKCLNSQVKHYKGAIEKFADMDALVAGELEGDKTYQRYKQLSLETIEQKTLDQLDDGLQIKKQDIETKIESLQERYSFKAINTKTSERIETLKTDERKIAEKIAELEGYQYLCEEFTRKKVDLLDSRINEKFSLVKFKMFKEQVNGGLALTCEAIVNGVPYSNANNAAQINAGLDIINALQEYYNFSCPIFIDNRESVTEIIDMDSQIINLSVSLSEELVVA
jgi:DNA repair exonuclease SbcCD ATPase subunit